MGKDRMHSSKALESLVQDILKSKAQSLIYLFLLRKQGAKTDEIIKGTHLHPSTVRETLVKMYERKLIIRKKQKNDNIGKNPYTYFPLPPIELLKKYSKELETKLNNLALLSMKNKTKRPLNIVKINIVNREEKL
jgi:predicted transcriptional regulator